MTESETLLLSAPAEDGDVKKLNAGSGESSSITLDELGPMVVNSDGVSLSVPPVFGS